ncbi:MAG: hypothetical protein ABIR03_14670 [Ginsengibacter sp.]
MRLLLRQKLLSIAVLFLAHRNDGNLDAVLISNHYKLPISSLRGAHAKPNENKSSTPWQSPGLL